MEVWHRKRGFMVENWICVIDLEYVSMGGDGCMKTAQGAYGVSLMGMGQVFLVYQIQGRRHC